MMKTTRETCSRLQAPLFGRFGSNLHFPALLPAVLCMAIFWPFGGGWKTVHMMAGTNTPAAHGIVKFKDSSNGNTALEVQTAALAQPSSLTPPENVYVLWIRPPGQEPQNMGQLKVNSNEQADLSTETAYKRFSVFITAEQNARIQSPTGPTVLSADIAR